ncbi:hypothetical protein [Kiloniella sp.]
MRIAPVIANRKFDRSKRGNRFTPPQKHRFSLGALRITEVIYPGKREIRA